MSFKRPLSVSPSPKEINRDKVWRQSKNSSKLGLCKICGDKASIINYGALSCQSCKIFFRRNALHPENIHSCSFNKSCEVNMDSRRRCTACRLDKCFSMGMSSDLIRKEEQKKRKYSPSTKFNTTKHAVSKQVISTSQPLMSNILHKNKSLNDSEWTLVWNVVHAHDKFTTMPQIYQIIEGLSTLPVEMQFDEINAFEIITLIYTSMQSFINSAPDFQILTTSEQFSLFERNLSSITVFCFVLIFSDAFINNEPKCIDLFTTVYGSDILFQAKQINKQLDYDSTIIKLMLLVHAFSSNSFIVDAHEDALNDTFLRGTHYLLESQNIYIELLWKFMLYHHDYYNSVLCFSRLMGLFLNLIKYSTIAYRTNAIYHKLVDNVFKKAKQSFMSDQNKDVRFWRKT